MNAFKVSCDSLHYCLRKTRRLYYSSMHMEYTACELRKALEPAGDTVIILLWHRPSLSGYTQQCKLDLLFQKWLLTLQLFWCLPFIVVVHTSNLHERMSPQGHVQDTILYLEIPHLIKPIIAIQHLIKSRNALLFHEITQLQSTQFSVIDNLWNLQKKNLLLVRANNPAYWKIIASTYSFKAFYIHYSSFQGQQILPVGQVNASLFTETFQHHTPPFW